MLSVCPRERSVVPHLLAALVLSLIITLAAILLAILTLTGDPHFWLAIPAILVALFFAALTITSARALFRRSPDSPSAS